MDELKHQERRWDRASEREHVTVAMAFPKVGKNSEGDGG